jgi:beta-N-acetylhexosaminidase
MTRRLLLAAVVAAASLGATADGGAASTPSVEQLVGQLLLVRMHGRVPSAAFLSRIRGGEIGGIVLFADNYGPAGPARLLAELQGAARAGGQLPLLVATDQEGGVVRRLPGAPSLAPPEMTSARVARAQGLATARNLAAHGINADLAPVLDVGRGGFITPRTFGSTAGEVASRGVAFARGLGGGGVLATAKHFPGLGYARANTDDANAVVPAKRPALLADLAPFRAAIAARIPLVLVSTAVYPALGSRLPAACSSAVVTKLLRRQLRFDGVVITDALESGAVQHFFSPAQAALKAVQSGVDMVLAAGPTGADADEISIAAYQNLLAAARDGRLSRARLEVSYRRIAALKRGLR